MPDGKSVVIPDPVAIVQPIPNQPDYASTGYNAYSPHAAPGENSEQKHHGEAKADVIEQACIHGLSLAGSATSVVPGKFSAACWPFGGKVLF